MFAVARKRDTTKQDKEKESTSDLYLSINLLKRANTIIRAQATWGSRELEMAEL